jgi:molecular chaperone DnaK
VEVSFDIDANGILNVKAKDKTSGKEQSIKIEARSTLTKEEIERMKKDAEAHAADDEKKREFAEAKNLGEQLAYTAEKALKDAGEKVPAETRKTIEDKISDLKTANKGVDVAQIKTATQNLSTELQKIGEIMAKAAKGDTTTPNPSSTEEGSKNDKGPEGNVRDAETK